MQVEEYLKDKLNLTDATDTQLVGTCPFCNKEKHFYANKSTGAWDCKRCGEAGSFWGLLKKLEDEEGYQIFFNKASQTQDDVHFLGKFKEKADYMYKYLTSVASADKAREYLNNRGITYEDIEKFHLGYASDINAISIPYFDKNEVIGIKYRLLATDSNLRYSNEVGSHVGLFNKNVVTEPTQALVICEGEFDCIVAQKLTNLPVVALPGKDTFKDEWLDLMSPLKKIYLCLDRDAQETAKKHALKLGAHKCYLVTMPYKDINEAYLQGLTSQEYAILLKEAKFLFEDVIISPSALVDLAVERMSDIQKKKGVSTGWGSLDDSLGGLRPGDLTILTGDTASGKTSFCVSLLFNQLQNNVPALFGSFEMEPATEILPKFCSINENKNLFLKELSQENASLIVKNFVKTYPTLFFIKGYGTTPLDEIGAAIKIAVERHNIKIVVLDHLHYFMDYTNDNQMASVLVEAMKKIKGWTIEYPDLHIILIVQTKQKKPYEEVDMDHIYGSSAIKQIGNNVIILKKKKKDTVVLNIAKSRSEAGKSGLDSNVYFVYNKDNCNFEEINEENFQEANDEFS